ncbi:MAG: endonuclease V [Phycisphaerae bacterium]
MFQQSAAPRVALSANTASRHYARGSSCALKVGTEKVGLVLRTRDGVKPVFVSVGHLIDLDTARRVVLDCACGFRLPEPTRQADILVAKLTQSDAGVTN